MSSALAEIGMSCCISQSFIKCLGEPEDIAGAVLYFAAPVSGGVSGQTLFVNGGGVQTLE